MYIRLLSIMFLAFALTGCILESKTPIIAASEGELALAQYGARFASYSTGDAGEWTKDKNDITFTANGNRYDATDGGSSTVSIAFRHIKENWWLMQGSEKPDVFAYNLADLQPGQIMIHPVACKDLKAEPAFGAFVAFTGDDCAVKEGADASALVDLLAARPGKATTKLEPIKP